MSRSTLSIPTHPKFLIVRLSAIGDCVHGLPVACALRDYFPTAKIGWIVEGRSADLLRGHSAIDEVFQIPRGWYKSFRETAKMRKTVRTFAPDITLDLQGLTKSAMIARISGAKTRIGFSGTEGREISSWLNNHLVKSTATHVVDKNLQLLESLGIVNLLAQFNLPIDSRASNKIDLFLKSHSLETGFALINPGAGWASKRWPVERFAEVARGLHSQHHVRSVIAWGPGEEKLMADRIVELSNGSAIHAPATTLLELVELARAATIFCSGDTGPLHLAAAVGTPCIALFGASDAARNGPYGNQHIAIQNIKLTGSSRSRRSADNAAISAINVDQVVAACGTLLTRNHTMKKTLAA
jgi:lipopolysaccharide heptosyltransferase I